MYRVMTLPKEISRKHRAARAGFMKFFPRPPNRHFTTRMANTPPRKGTYSGTLAGRHSASSRPVTAALPSVTVVGFLVTRQKMASVATEESIHTAMTKNAWKPLTHTPTTAAGSRDRTTSSMTFPVVSRLRRWGLADIWGFAAVRTASFCVV